MAIVPDLSRPVAQVDTKQGNVTFPQSLPDPDIGATTVTGNVAAIGVVELTGGASGSVDGITVNAVEIMSGAENFDTDLPTTAAAVAANITAHTSDPNYTAEAEDEFIYITSVVPGSEVNGFAVVASTTTITADETDMSGGENHLLVDPVRPIITYES